MRPTCWCPDTSIRRCLYCGLTCSVCSVLLLVPSVCSLALITTCEHNPKRVVLLVPCHAFLTPTVWSCEGPLVAARLHCCENPAQLPVRFGQPESNRVVGSIDYPHSTPILQPFAAGMRHSGRCWMSSSTRRRCLYTGCLWGPAAGRSGPSAGGSSRATLSASSLRICQPRAKHAV